MARKRRTDKQEEQKVSYDYSKNGGNGSVGLSAEAQKALDTGTYGQMNTRKAQYNTSMEQTQQSKSLPVLKGASISNTSESQPAWESSFGKSNRIDTERARKKYETEVLNHTPTSKITADSFEKYDEDMKKAEFIARNNPSVNPEIKNVVNNLPSYTAMPEKDRKQIYKNSQQNQYDKNKLVLKNTKASYKGQEANLDKNIFSKLTPDELDAIHEGVSNHLHWDENGKMTDTAVHDASRDASYYTFDDETPNQDYFLKKYGVSTPFLVKAYADSYWRQEEEKRNRKLASEHPVRQTAGTIMNEAFIVPMLGADEAVMNLIDPEDTSISDQRRRVSNVTNYQRDEITKDMPAAARSAYNIGTGVADKIVGTAAAGKAAPVLTTFRTAAHTRDSLDQRGIEGRGAVAQSVISGAVDAGLDVVGLEKIGALNALKSGNLVQTIIGSGAIGGGEQFITSVINEAIDRIANRDKSAYNMAVQQYLAQGMSEDDAKEQALLETAERVAEETGQGIVFGELMGVGGKYGSRIPKLAFDKAADVYGKVKDSNFKKNMSDEIRNIVEGKIPKLMPNGSVGIMDNSLREFIADGMDSEKINIDGADYSIDRTNNNLIDANGNEVPIIDPSVFDTSKRGTPEQTKRQFAAQLTKYIKDNYLDKTFIIKDNGHEIGFIDRSAKEYAGSRSSMRKSNEKMGVKANIAPRLQSVIENAIFNHHEDNVKSDKPIKARGLDKYDISIAYPTENGIELYDATMDIGLHKDGNEYFFDILNIEPKKKTDPRLLSDDSVTNLDRPSFDNNIRQNGENVNKYMKESAGLNNPKYVQKLEGNDLTDAQNTVKKNSQTIKALKNEIKLLEEDPKSKRNGKVIKNVQDDIDARKQQIKDLQGENKALNRQIKGEPTPVKEQLTKEQYNAIYGKYDSINSDIFVAQKLAGDTPEANQLAANAKAALGRYIESGDKADLKDFLQNVSELDVLARDSGGEYVTKNNRYSYDDWYGRDVNSMGDEYSVGLTGSVLNRNGLQAIDEFHKARGSAPIEEPAPVIPDNAETLDVPPSENNGMSRVVTHSAINADIISQKMLDSDPVLQDIAKYAKHSNEQTFNSAMDNVKKNGTGLLDEYISDKRKIDNDLDVDQAMIILQNLSQQIRDMGNEAPADLINQRNLLLSRLRATGTKYGQTIQAFAKWNNTPEGAVMNGEAILANAKDKWKGRNKQRVALNGRIAKALEQMGVDSSMRNQPEKAPLTRDQVKQGVMNVLEREFGSIENLFKDEDIEFLTDLAENKKIPVWQITNEIEHFLNHGEWYEITEDTPVIREQSKRLQNLLDKAVGGKQLEKPAKAPETFAETVDKIRATFEDGEYAGFEDNFGEDDYRFIATMFHEKVPSWQIEDELRHKMETGEWYTLDESTPTKKPVSQKLQNAFNSLIEREPTPEKEPLTLNEVRDQVRNTLSKEGASLDDFSDQDVDYLSNLIMNGATRAELTEALNTKLATGKFAISADTQQKVNELFEYASHYDPNSKEAFEAKSAAYKLIADEVVGDASPFEKFESWRYLAMLGNPKTMFRNWIGNQMFNAATGISNNLAAAMEEGVDWAVKKAGGEGIQRTKAILNPSKDRSLIKAAGADLDSHRYAQAQGGKYEKSIQDNIRGQKSVFNSKFAQTYEKLTDKGISDYNAVKRKYATSLAGYMKANGLDEKAFDAESYYRNLQKESQYRLLTDSEKAKMADYKQTMDAVEKARDFAFKQAEYATFHEDNVVAKFLTKLSGEDAPFLSRALIEGLVPFKKTPANVLRSGVEFSPLNAIKSIKETGKLIYENTGARKGNLEDTYTKKSWLTGKDKEVNKTLASDVIDSWAKTLTGSGLMALGYYLFDKGVLNSSNEGEKYQDELEGKQNYSITINGKTYTIDWAAPAVMPLLMGAELSKLSERHGKSDESFYNNVDEIYGAVGALFDPLFETSMLQGVQNTAESVARSITYGNTALSKGFNIFGALVGTPLTSYATQALPTMSGQIARTVDPTRRATDTAHEGLIGDVEKQGRKLMNKIPGLSQFNNPYYDAYGRMQNNSPSNNPLLNLLYQSVSPAYVQDINTTRADESARGAFNGLDSNGNPIKDENVFAAWKNSVKVNGEKLNPDQMAEYRQTTGKANYDIRTALAKEPWFNELDAARQTEILKKVNTLVDKVGKEKYTDVTGKDYEAYKKGGIPSLLDYYNESSTKKEITEKTGLNANSNAAKAIKADLDSGNKEAAEEKMSDADRLSSLGFTKPGPIDTFYKAQGIDPSLTPNEFAQTYNEIDADGNQGIKQDELIAYFNNNHFTSESEAMQIWSMFAPKGKKVPYLKKDGTWGKH